MPAPRGADDILKTVIARLPAKHALCLVRRRHKLRGVAIATGAHFSGYRVTGYAACGLDDFVYCVAHAVAEIKHVAFSIACEIVKS